jgi:hypothetical protein
MACAALLLAVAGCSTSDAAGGTSADVTPPILLPTTQRATKAATDCKQSTVALPAESEIDGVQLEVSTDDSHTSLLVKNTGSLTVVVIPDATFDTRLISAPHADPKDSASRAALIAVNNSGARAAIREIPKYVPATQTITLPPQWAVCALTDNVEETAGVRYLQDKASSAEYFVAKGLADQLLARMSVGRAAPTLVKCTRATLTELTAHPELPDIEQYADILGSGSSCRNSYKALLQGNEHDTAQLSSAVLNRLEGAPRLAAGSRLFDAVARS